MKCKRGLKMMAMSFCLSVRSSVCLSPETRNKVAFSQKTKQFRATISIDDQYDQ